MCIRVCQTRRNEEAKANQSLETDREEINTLKYDLRAAEREKSELKLELSNVRASLTQQRTTFGATAQLDDERRHKLKIQELKLQIRRNADFKTTLEETVSEQQKQISRMQLLLEVGTGGGGSLRDRDRDSRDRSRNMSRQHDDSMFDERFNELRTKLEAKEMELAQARQRILDLEQTLSLSGIEKSEVNGSAGAAQLMASIVALRKELLATRREVVEREAQIQDMYEGRLNSKSNTQGVGLEHEASGVLHWMTMYYAVQEKNTALTNEITLNSQRYAKELAQLRAQLMETEVRRAIGPPKREVRERELRERERRSSQEKLEIREHKQPQKFRNQLNNVNPTNGKHISHPKQLQRTLKASKSANDLSLGTVTFANVSPVRHSKRIDRTSERSTLKKPLFTPSSSAYVGPSTFGSGSRFG